MKKEGPFSLYKGLGTLLVGSAPISTMVFTLTETSKRQLKHKYPQMSSSLTSLFAGGFAGLIALSISTPVEVLKCRAQMKIDGNLSAKAEIKSLLKNEGIFGMYRGFWLMAAREIPGCAVYFASYELIKDLSSKILTKNKKSEDIP